MNSLTQRFRRSTFIRHNAIFFVGSLLIGALNYLYYPVLGRLLQPVAFGEVQALISLFLQITTFLSVLGLLAVNIITNYEDVRSRNRIVFELEKLALLISFALVVLAGVGGAWLRQYFHFGSAMPFVMLALAIVMTVPFTFRTSYLRAKHYFGLQSAAGIVGAAGKLFLSALFVLAGFRTSGAIFGVVLAQIAAFMYAGYYARKHGFTESLRGQLARLPDLKLIWPEFKYSLLVLATSLTITILYSIDIIVVKHFFDAYTAGLYASIATVSRILFFLTASIAQVMMPAVRLKSSPRENTRVLVRSFLLLVVVGGGALLVFFLAPRLIVRLLMGETYLRYADLLPRLSLALFVVSILNLFMTYYMALRRSAVGLIGLGGAGLTWLWMQASHDSLTAVVNGLLYGSLLTTAVLMVWMVLKDGKALSVKGGNT